MCCIDTLLIGSVGEVKYTILCNSQAFPAVTSELLTFSSRRGGTARHQRRRRRLLGDRSSLRRCRQSQQEGFARLHQFRTIRVDPLDQRMAQRERDHHRARRAHQRAGRRHTRHTTRQRGQSVHRDPGRQANVIGRNGRLRGRQFPHRAQTHDGVVERGNTHWQVSCFLSIFLMAFPF